MTSQAKRLRMFCEERDAVLRSLDLKEYKKFNARWGLPWPDRWVKPTVPYAAMHTARLDVVAFTKEEKLASAQWLLANGYQLPDHIKLVEGELVGATYAH